MHLGKNEEHDARCYETIFAEQFPDAKFISGGSSKEVMSDRLKFAAVFSNVIKGISVRRVIDRDDHGQSDVDEFKKNGIWTLRRRHLECYLYDDEVLAALYLVNGKLLTFVRYQEEYDKFVSESVRRNSPTDDIKSAAPQIYTFVKKHLGLVACGNDQAAFSRNVLASLVKPGLKVYDELSNDIFGRAN